MFDEWLVPVFGDRWLQAHEARVRGEVFGRALAGVIGIIAADDGAAVGAGEPLGQDMDDPGRGQGQLWLAGQRKPAGRERINGEFDQNHGAAAVRVTMRPGVVFFVKTTSHTSCVIALRSRQPTAKGCACLRSWC